MRTLQKFAAVPASVDILFNTERSLYSRQNFMVNRAFALVEWRGLSAKLGAGIRPWRDRVSSL